MTLENNGIEILKNVFIIQRIIDPKNKRIINFDNTIRPTESHKCYDYWKNQTPCSNCISMRALNENASFTKLETSEDKTYMIIAAPFKLNENNYVIELIKDVTNDTMLSLYKDKTIDELKREIDRLNTIVVTDELTKIFNRRYLDEHLPVALKNLSKSNFSISLVMLDIDKFKSINDTYGHLCGDYVLKEVAHLLDNYIKTFNGWTCRYGGDEFIAVIENVSVRETYKIIKNLKNLIKNTDFIYENNKINVTCSFGITHFNKNNINFDEALKLVDDKLYRSKKNKDTIS